MKLVKISPVVLSTLVVSFTFFSTLWPRGAPPPRYQSGIVLFWTDKVNLVPYATHITPDVAIGSGATSNDLSQSRLIARGVTPLEAAPGKALSGLTDAQILDKWDGLCRAGYVALGFDEFGGWNHRANARFARLLRKFHEQNPNIYIAVWNAGHLDPALARAYRDVANLVMMEAYGHWGLRLILRFTYRLMQVRYFGLVHKTIFGIGIDDAASTQTLASWGRWANNYADLDRQLAWIAWFAPDMPGVGFFAPYASDHMLKIADNLAHFYFQKP